MKKLLFVVLVTLFFSAKAQVQFIGKVAEENNLKPVYMAKISFGKSTVFSDTAGCFVMQLQDSVAEVVLTHPAYNQRSLSLANIEQRLILLTPKTITHSRDLVFEDKEFNIKSMKSVIKSAGLGVGNIENAKLAQPGRIPPQIYPDSEEYSQFNQLGYQLVSNMPLSTFSIDVDVASYSRIRRYLNNGTMPNKLAVRIEEMINYFDYDYAKPENGAAASVKGELGICPWNKEHRLLRIAVNAKEIATKELPRSNFVFLVDVSGSMNSSDKLPLLQSAMRMFVNNMRHDDRIALVTYAGSTKVVLESTSGKEKELIMNAINNLTAGGSTAGAAGLTLAYNQAEKGFVKNGNNRILLATDGDFNVGPSSVDDLISIVKQYRNKGIFMSVLGFGVGNLKDNKMEAIADNGNGNYAYIDNALEANKVLVKESASTLFTVAKDVKIQVEFNPTHVSAYRLIGYDNRLLDAIDFNDDNKDAGEMGAGHTVTALYEIVPASAEPLVDPLRYQKSVQVPDNKSDEWALIKLRYKEVNENKSKRLSCVVSPITAAVSTDDFTFAAAVAAFGMLLKDSEYVSDIDYSDVANWASASIGRDSNGYRAEFVRLVEMAGLMHFSQLY